jgi:hypothetical protein
LQEAFDLLTPIAVIPPLWLAFNRTTALTPRTTAVILALAALWIGAQGLHLGTNAIGDLFDPGPSRDAFYQTAPGALDLWFDEVLSHWLWHLAWAALLLALAVIAYRVPLGEAVADRRTEVMAGIGGVIQGLTWMVVTIEGSTSVLGIPTAAAILGLGFGLRRRGPTARAVGIFLMSSGIMALGLYGLYIARYGWPPPELTQTILGG